MCPSPSGLPHCAFSTALGSLIRWCRPSLGHRPFTPIHTPFCLSAGSLVRSLNHLGLLSARPCPRPPSPVPRPHRRPPVILRGAVADPARLGRLPFLPFAKPSIRASTRVVDI